MKPTAETSIPTDCRYIPMTQQDYCCIPACILMTMYRLRIPLVPMELLAEGLGLSVPSEQRSLFAAELPNVDDTARPYGLQKRTEEDLNGCFRELNIPLRVQQMLASSLEVGQFIQRLWRAEEEDSDIMVYFNNFYLYGVDDPLRRHAAVVDRRKGERVRLVDPSYHLPKWRLVEPVTLYEASVICGDDMRGGLWYFRHT